LEYCAKKASSETKRFLLNFFAWMGSANTTEVVITFGLNWPYTKIILLKKKRIFVEHSFH
jgi:hypothetical protein